jgi:hypothetical protein
MTQDAAEAGQDTSTAVRLLADLRIVFGGVGRLYTSTFWNGSTRSMTIRGPNGRWPLTT